MTVVFWRVADWVPSNLCFFLQMVTRTKKIFVGGLSAPTTLEDVKNYFEQFGPVSTQHLATLVLCLCEVSSLHPSFVLLKTTFVEQSISWEANSFPLSQYIPFPTLWHPHIYYRLRNKPPPGPILNQFMGSHLLPVSLTYISILSSRLGVGIEICLIPSDFPLPPKPCIYYCFFPRAACLVHLILYLT
jgi:RNA recognition motif-containing protein